MLQELKKILNDKEIFIKKNYIELVIKNKKDILSIFTDLKQNKLLLFDQLIDITAIDHPSQNLRFELIYILLSMTKNKRLILKTNLKEGDGIDSISKIYKSANWYERECYDLFGIEFFNHPDLRRIMTDYNFEGHPLRKDFPLTGHNEVRYDELEKKVIYEEVNLPQEYRNFDYLSPWEGLDNELIGDKKSDDKGKV